MKKKLLKSLSHVSAMTMVSRVMGLLRDIAIAYVLGAHLQADAFFVAFKIPNFMRRLFAEGAFSQAFVPVLVQYRQAEDQDSTKDFIDHMAGALGIVLVLTVVLAILTAPYLLRVFAPGFVLGSERYILCAHILRLMFPYLFFISMTAFASAILNSFNRFAMPALTPIWLNVSLILAASLAWYFVLMPAYVLAWGVLIAGMLQFIFLWPFLKQLKLVPRPRFKPNHPGVKQVLKLMVPALLGVSVAQVNLMIDTLFASFLPIGSIAWLYNSDRLASLPLGVFGVGLATVILPHLSRQHVAKNDEAYQQGIDWALRWLMLIAIPSSIGLMCLAGPLLTTLLQYGAFKTHDVWMAAESLRAFAVGVPAFMGVKVLASAYYARKNINTPVRIAIIAMLSNVILNMLLIKPLAHQGLALATSLASYLNFILLYIKLRYSSYYKPSSGWPKIVSQCLVANSVMLVCLLSMRGELSQWSIWHWYQRGYQLLLLIVIAIACYFATLWLLRFNWKSIQ